RGIRALSPARRYVRRLWIGQDCQSAFVGVVSDIATVVALFLARGEVSTYARPDPDSWRRFRRSGPCCRGTHSTTQPRAAPARRRSWTSPHTSRALSVTTSAG